MKKTILPRRHGDKEKNRITVKELKFFVSLRLCGLLKK